MSLKKIFNTKLWLPVTLLLLFGLNWLGSRWHGRIDLTNEKRFTLSAPTKKLLQKLDDEFSIKVFLKGASNSGFTKLSRSAEEMLQEFREIAGSNFHYEFVDPADNVEGTSTSWADSFRSVGIAPLVLNKQLKNGEQQELAFPVAIADYGGYSSLVSLYEGSSSQPTAPEVNSAEAMMEYNFSKAISQLTNTNRPLIAYSIGNGEPKGPETADLQRVLQSDNEFFTFDINKGIAIPDTFNILMIVKPTKPFSDEEKLKIDQYVMRGGKLLVFMDKLNSEMDTLKATNEITAYDRDLQISDLFFKYGIRINSDLVMDLQCDQVQTVVNGGKQMELLPWNYFPMFQSKENHIINKGLGFVTGKFVNSIDTVEAEGIIKTSLLSTSPNSRTISTPALISMRENVNAPESDKFKRSAIPVAYLLEGKFNSLFRNRVSQAQLDTMNANGIVYYPQSYNNNKMIVAADGDLVLNSFRMDKMQPLAMGVNPYSMVNGEQVFPIANRSFLQNCVDYLLNQDGLMEAKAKDYTLQFLDPRKIEKEKTTWQIINIGTPVLLVCIFALIYQWWRRRRYSK